MNLSQFLTTILPHRQTRRAISRAHTSPHRPWPFTLSFQNVITLSAVAKGTTDEVWWQSDLNWRQKVVHKHIHLRVYIIYSTYWRRRKQNLPSRSVCVWVIMSQRASGSWTSHAKWLNRSLSELKNSPRSRIEVGPTALPRPRVPDAWHWPLTLTYDLDFQSQESYGHVAQAHKISSSKVSRFKRKRCVRANVSRCMRGNHGSLAYRIHYSNGISIGSAVFAQLTNVIDRHTNKQTPTHSDRPHYSVCSKYRPLSLAITAIQSNNV